MAKPKTEKSYNVFSAWATTYVNSLPTTSKLLLHSAHYSKMVLNGHLISHSRKPLIIWRTCSQTNKVVTLRMSVVRQSGTEGSSRDCKSTVSLCLKIGQYPLHRIKDIFVKLAGGKRFTKIDLKQVCLQIQMDESSKPLTSTWSYINKIDWHLESHSALTSDNIWSIKPLPAC